MVTLGVTAATPGKYRWGRRSKVGIITAMVWVELDTTSKRSSHSWERKARKKKRKKEEPVSLSELNKPTLHPMQTWEMGFSLEMNRLGDNDADDCFLFLTFHVVSWRPCCVYHQQTCILKSQLFSGYCCQHLCKSRKLHKLLPQQNVCMLEPLCRWICRSWGTMRKLRNVLLALSVFLNSCF